MSMPPSSRVFACQRCFRRKQRCDRILPACSQCKAAGSACHNSEKENTVVHLNDKEIAKKGYITIIQERIALLEAEATRRGLEVENIASHEDRADEAPPRTAGSEERPRSATDARWQLEEGNMNMSSLTLRAMAEPQNRAGEFLKELSMPRIISRVTETYGGNPETSTRVDSLWDGIAKYIRRPAGQGGRLDIQPSEASNYLKTYMDVVDFRFPRLPVKKVQRGLDAITCHDESKYEAALSESPAYIFLAYMVIAIVSLVLEDHPVAQGSFVSIHVLAKCLGVLNQVFSQEDGVDIIQCLHLLVVFSIHSSAAGSSWHLIGFAVNKCIALGYHREPSPLLARQRPEELEQRRWAFWSCYLLDRLICGALGRPFSIEDRYITISLPGEGSESPSQLSPTEAYYSHLFRYSILLSSVTSKHKVRDFEFCLGQILHWRASAPPRWDDTLERLCAHQTSLYNTLLLRVAIQQITSPYDFQEFEDGTGRIRYVNHQAQFSSCIPTHDILMAEQNRIKKLRLFEICRSVSQSLDRPTMVRRPFLSMTTGYSAFSMALATLYCCAVISRAQQDGVCERSGNTACRPSCRDRILRTAETNGDRNDAMRHKEGESEGEVPEADRLLETACQKIDIVGRQFPRMQDFRKTIELLRSVVNLPCADPGDSHKTATREMIQDIGPCHLRELAQATLFLLQ